MFGPSNQRAAAAAGFSLSARATAFRQLSRITFHRFAAISSAVAIHVPPTARTALSARYSLRLAWLMPPVGRKRTPVCKYGAAMLLSMATPPAAPAGKNFRTFTPRLSAPSMSVGVIMPGENGNFSSSARATMAGLKPGATPNAAPHSTARIKLSVVRIVPAPTSTSGRSRAIRSMTAAAASVRNVISATGKPPSASASASPEIKSVNKIYNRRTGEHVDSGFLGAGTQNAKLARRIDGDFTGTTEEILRWAACKWGIDQNIVFAQAAVESWWRQTTLGDWGTDTRACPPGHGLGAEGKAGECPQSYGILQNRYPFEEASWPGIGRSTAMNADTAYAIWRSCYDGYETWLNTVPRGR